jgi:hypothetical protein
LDWKNHFSNLKLPILSKGSIIHSHPKETNLQSTTVTTTPKTTTTILTFTILVASTSLTKQTQQHKQ